MRSDDDEPGWMMGTICTTAQLHMESIRQKQWRLDKLTQPGKADTTNQFCQRDTKYGTAELTVQEVVKPQMVTTSATTIVSA